MSPYTQLVSIDNKFHLSSAMYRRDSEGNQRIYVVERKLPPEVFTADGGIRVDIIGTIAHWTITRTNSIILTSVAIQKGQAPKKYKCTFGSRIILGDRIQDLLIQLLEIYNRYISDGSIELIRDYI